MRRSAAIVVLMCVALGRAARPAAGGSAAAPPIQLPEGRSNRTVTAEGEQKIPVLQGSDVLVAEGTLAGCVVAWQAARSGRSVALAASGASLPHDIAIALRPWAREGELARLPGEFADAFRNCVRERSGDGEVIFDLAKLAIATEDLLLDAGVKLWYGLRPCGVAKSGDRLAAVVFAAKGGLVAFRATATVDCTADARLAALAGARFADRPLRDGRLEVRYTMLASGPLPRELPVQGVPELLGQRLFPHGPFAEFRMRLAARGEAAFRDAELTLRSRIVAANAGRALSGVAFARGGDALWVQPSRRIVTRSQAEGLDLAACQPQGVEGLLVCGPAADVPDEVAAALAEPFGALAVASVVARSDWAKLCAGADPTAPVQAVLAGKAEGAHPPASKAQARLGIVQAIRRADSEIAVGRPDIPIVAETDVLVVGGGTSGVPAALVAAQNGAKTLLVEAHSDLGGTHTLGGVSKYWFGRPTDFVRQLDRDALALLSGTGMPKSLALLYSLVASGVSVVPQCQAVGALVEGDAVKGVVVVTPTGLGAIAAKAVIDATGDGDVAAWAGAEHSWGTGRDALTLWFSFGHFVGPKSEASRQYHSAVDLRDPSDYARAIIAARRRTGIFGQGDAPQYYLAPRESRHIKGRATVTYGDILAERRWPDAVVVAQSNFDIKGLASSDLALCGYAEQEFTKNYAAAIPYRALVPEKLEGILVVGKAYSITHDALSLARMQRDLMAMGGAAGLAASMAARAKCPVASVSIPDLQKGLIKLGILRPSDLPQSSTSGGATLNVLVEGAAEGQPPKHPQAKPLEGGTLQGPQSADGEELVLLIRDVAAASLPRTQQAKVLAHREATLPLLKQALPAASPAGRLDVAKALCLLGDAEGVPILLEELGRRLGGEKLPVSPQKSHDVPDHAYAPEPCFLINAIGVARDRRLVPLLRPLAERIALSPGKSDDAFSYVFAIAYACERIGNPAAVEALEVLADKPAIKSAALAIGTDPRKSVSHVAERHAYLELCVGRALARCGSPRGYEILIGYLGDIRGILARSAHGELADLAGRDLGPSPEPWRQWLAQTPRPLEPKPFLRHIE